MSGSFCCWKERPAGRPASSVSGTESWWSPIQTHQRLGPIDKLAHYQESNCMSTMVHKKDLYVQ
jgi:hypothetical protein